MRWRWLVGAVAATLLTACGSGDVVPGFVDSSSGTRTPPCALPPSAASAVPSAAPSSGPAAAGCGPVPTTTAASSSASSATSSTTTSPGPGNPATFARYARKVFATRLGDPAVLNVCRIASAVTVTGVTFQSPTSTSATTCALDIAGSGVPAGAQVIVSIDSAGPYVSPKPRTTTVSGLPVLTYPYESSIGDCKRAIVLKQPDVQTLVSVSSYARGLAPTRICAINTAFNNAFLAVATGRAPRSLLPTATPSMLSLDVCKVAAAANLRTLPAFAGAEYLPGGFAVSCRIGTGPRNFVIATGALRNIGGVPDGDVTPVDGHPIYEDVSDAGSCTATSLQAGGEIVRISTTAAQAADVPTCDAMATAVARYVQVLGLR